MQKETPQKKVIGMNDIVPDWSKLKLKGLPEELTLRPFDLKDDAWLVEEFGETFDLQKLSNYDLARIGYHQVTNEDKIKWFTKKTVRVVNEAGDESEEQVGGLDLFFSFISGLGDKMALYRAILRNVGISAPLLDAFEKELLEKKSQEIQNKVEEVIGDGFSISFQPSTVGRPSISPPARAGRSTGASKKSIEKRRSN